MTRDQLQGRWRVRRVSGLLPPGVTKEIHDDGGRTLLFGITFGRFRLDGSRLVYRLWPIVDDVETSPTGDLVGEGRLLGWRFCRFRLEPLR